eukprot:6314371-Amphidinium_carterae.1
MAVRRHCRSTSGLGSRLLVLCDNLVSVLAFDKGRSQSFALNALCRRMCAFLLACDVRLGLRHIVSEDNPADAGSRRGQPPTHAPGVKAVSSSTRVAVCGDRLLDVAWMASAR